MTRRLTDNLLRRPLTLAHFLADRFLLLVFCAIGVGALLIYHQRIQTRDESSIRRAAAELGHLVPLSPLTRNDVNTPLPDGDTLLCLAARCGRSAAVELLLARGADPNRPCRSGTPVMEAARAGQAATLRLLLDAGADPSASTYDGNDAIQDAVRSQSLDCFHILLAAGVCPTRPGMRDNPLSLVAAPAEIDWIDRLLSAGADPNLPGRDGFTPLMVASYERSPATVERLLLAGADPDQLVLPGAAPSSVRTQLAAEDDLSTQIPRRGLPLLRRIAGRLAP